MYTKQIGPVFRFQRSTGKAVAHSLVGNAPIPQRHEIGIARFEIAAVINIAFSLTAFHQQNHAVKHMGIACADLVPMCGNRLPIVRAPRPVPVFEAGINAGNGCNLRCHIKAVPQ
jgi:hypothetical protein